MPDSTLAPIAPEEAVCLYSRHRGTELAEETIEPYRYKLTRFIEWCEQEDIDNIDELSGHSLLQSKLGFPALTRTLPSSLGRLLMIEPLTIGL